MGGGLSNLLPYGGTEVEITLTPAQYEELQTLASSVKNLQNQGSVSGEIVIDSTKVEYSVGEVKFTISD